MAMRRQLPPTSQPPRSRFPAEPSGAREIVYRALRRSLASSLCVAAAACGGPDAGDPVAGEPRAGMGGPTAHPAMVARPTSGGMIAGPSLGGMVAPPSAGGMAAGPPPGMGVPSSTGEPATAEPGGDGQSMEAEAPDNGVPQCRSARWRLASGFSPERDVSYLADRMEVTAGEVQVLSQTGMPCADAVALDDCERALTLSLPGRHLLTTEDGQVRLWGPEAALTLFGAVDTPEEAIWRLLTRGYTVGCDSRIEMTPQGFVIEADRSDNRCMPGRVFAAVLVDPAGTVTERVTNTEPGTDDGCVIDGRRPEGLCSVPGGHGGSELGEHFARMAHMEAASVPAFAAIFTELRSYRAPASLIRDAYRAVRDERRHAEIAARLARRHGSEPAVPVVMHRPVRSLEAFAIDNAVEGCVNETYAAAQAAHQASQARDPFIRQALAGIAADEARHAALSWRIAAWIAPELSRPQAARVRAAQAAAVGKLAEECGAERPRTLRTAAGLPSVAAAQRLHASLNRTLWRV